MDIDLILAIGHHLAVFLLVFASTFPPVLRVETGHDVGPR